ncbi:MAG: hypothetical protein ABJB17_10985 [Burkholderiales bacterium]
MLAATLTACDRSGGAQTDPQKLAAALSGQDRAAADQNPQCKLFTPAELSKFVGTPLASGHVAAMGSGCQWLASSGDGSALIQVVPARYHEPHSGAAGFKNLPDIGTRGFVENDLGWNAGTIIGSESVVVSVTGPAANAATAIALLKETIARKAK